MNIKEEADLVGLRIKTRVGRSRMAGYIRHASGEYKILLNPKGQAVRLHRQRGMPAFYMTGKDGKIVWQKYGFTPRSVPMFDQDQAEA
jgi:hypothetical protein